MGRCSRPHVGPTLLLWVATLAALHPTAQAARALPGRVTLVKQVAVGRALRAAPADSTDTGSSTGGGAQECDSNSMLDALNALRAEHGASPLSWSADLAQQAMDVVAKQADNPLCQFQFALTSHGESQAKWTNLDCVGAVDLWRGEESKYAASGGGSYVPEAASFTQIIWKETTEVGCAYVFGGCDGSDMGYVSCLYETPGNYNGGFDKNVQMSQGPESPAAESPAEESPMPEESPAEESPAPEESPAEESPTPEESPAGESPMPEESPAEESPAEESPMPEESPAEESPAPEESPAEESPMPEESPAQEDPGQQDPNGNNNGGGNQQGGGTASCDIQATLDAHNAARAKHGAAPLKWDAALAEYALGVVNSQSEVNCGLVHSNGPYGENLAYGTNFNCVDAVNLWMQEEAQWVPGTNHFVSGQGHYTQIVWKATTSVGCALVPNKCGGFNYIACSYDPPGNMAGGFLDNVQ